MLGVAFFGLLSLVPFLYPKAAILLVSARDMALTKRIAPYALLQIMKISGSSMELQFLDCQRPWQFLLLIF